MYHEHRSHQVDGPQPGAGLDIEDLDRSVRVHAAVVATTGGRIALRLATPVRGATEGIFRLHWLDLENATWQADCVGFVGEDQALLDVELSDGWQPSEGRCAARFEADRRAVPVMVPDRPALSTVTTIDVSATGCCISATGEPLPVGTELDLDLTAGSYTLPLRLHAVVARIYRAAFGRFEAGLRFEPTSAAERYLILRWRDEAAVSDAALPLRVEAA
jgi:hypothetical protein